MLTLYHKPGNAESERVKNKLEELCLTFKLELTDAEQVPRLTDSSGEVKGPAEIASYLDQLEKELNFQRSLSGDGCYIDPESGEVC